MSKIKFLFLLIVSLLRRYFKKLVLFLINNPLHKKPEILIRNHPNKFLSNNYIHSKRLSKFYLVAVLALFLSASFIIYLYKSGYFWNHWVSEGIVGIYQQENLPGIVTGLISDPLVTIGKDGLYQPKLASGWEVNKEADVYIFRIKDNLYWHDGTKVESKDIYINLPNVEISYPDPLTIQFKLEEPFVPFPSLLTNPILKKGSLIGVGKYKVIQQDISKNIVNQLILIPKDENMKDIPKIIIKFYPDDKVTKTAFEVGEIDSIIGYSDVQDFVNVSTIGVKKIVNYNKIVGVFYNTKDPFLSDKNFRKGLSASLPELKEGKEATNSIQPSSWAYNGQIKKTINNQQLAKSYLDKVTNGKEETLTLTTIPSLSVTADEIVKAWNKVGIKAVARVESGSPQNYQAILTSQYISQDPDQYALWHSSQSVNNLSNYKSDRVDRDLEDGRKNIDQNIRKERYFDFQKVLNDDCPASFLYFPNYNFIYRRKIEDSLEKIVNLQAQYIK